MMANTAGNLKNPSKTLPKAIFLAIGIVLVLYLVLSYVVLTNVPAHGKPHGHGVRPHLQGFRRMAGAPSPASTTTGTTACSMMMLISSLVSTPLLVPMGRPEA